MLSNVFSLRASNKDMASGASGRLTLKFQIIKCNKEVASSFKRMSSVASGQIYMKFDYYLVKSQFKNELWSFRPDLYQI